MGRNKEVNQKIRDERRDQILAQALTVFSTRGLAAAKISHIAKLAGISQGLMYHYFGSKEEVFVELIQMAFQRLNSSCDILRQVTLAPGDKIAIAVEGLLQDLELNQENARYHMLMVQAMVSEGVSDEVRVMIRREMSALKDLVAEILREGQEAGSVRAGNARELARVFWNAINAQAMFKAVEDEDFQAPEAAVLLRMFLCG